MSISLPGASSEVLELPSACTVLISVGVRAVQVRLQASKRCQVFPLAASLTVLDTIHHLKMSCVFLHVVVALKEVGYLPTAEFGVSELASGCGSAQYELTALLGACLRALICVYELFYSI